jgi:CheY-like chemotaxis protein
MMPNMDGFQFREEQLKRPNIAGIPIAVFSADSHAKEKAARLMAAAVVQKPLKIGALVELVNSVLASRPATGRSP